MQVGMSARSRVCGLLVFGGLAANVAIAVALDGRGIVEVMAAFLACDLALMILALTAGSWRLEGE